MTYKTHPDRELSVVLPVYKTRYAINELYERLVKVLKNNRYDYELVFVDDACPQNSKEQLFQLAAEDPAVKVVSLSTNHGQHWSILFGFFIASGQHIVVMDADLQDPPEFIPTLIKKANEGFGIVFGGRYGRYEEDSRLLSSRLFKLIFSRLARVPKDAGSFFIINYQIKEKVLDFPVLPPFITSILAATDAHTCSVPVERSTRPHGGSAYDFFDRLKVGGRAIQWTLSWRTKLWRIRQIKDTYRNYIQSRIGEACLLNIKENFNEQRTRTKQTR